METLPKASSRKLSTLCVIVPGLNEGENLIALYDELQRSLGGHHWALEVLFVDDGSTDNTLDICRQLHRRDPNFQYISLSRNFGHQRALTAGLDVVRGEAVVVMDADLQDPPSVVLEMIAVWEQGIDMVYGKRLTRDGETMMKKVTAKLFYQLLRHMTSTPIPEDTGDFRLMDRRVVLQLRRMREQARFLRGMVSWVGFSCQPVFYHRLPRQRGTTKYPFFRMLRFAWEGITSFSAAPLRLATVAGIGFSIMAFAMAGYYILRQIIYQDFIKGWASVMVAIFLVGGLQLLFIGIVGEYLAKAFDELKDRPLYILAESSMALDEGAGDLDSTAFPLEVVPEPERIRQNSR